MKSDREIQDVIVVGAGPAGLTAAIYLGRFRRRCIVLEDGQSRARWMPTSHNSPGFTAGIGDNQFLTTLTEHALQYGARILRANVSSLAVDDHLFALATDQGIFQARYVVLAILWHGYFAGYRLAKSSFRRRVRIGRH
jgi:thioredoxin reductase (NADPH)